MIFKHKFEDLVREAQSICKIHDVILLYSREDLMSGYIFKIKKDNRNINFIIKDRDLEKEPLAVLIAEIRCNIFKIENINPKTGDIMSDFIYNIEPISISNTEKMEEKFNSIVSEIVSFCDENKINLRYYINPNISICFRFDKNDKAIRITISFMDIEYKNRKIIMNEIYDKIKQLYDSIAVK